MIVLQNCNLLLDLALVHSRGFGCFMQCKWIPNSINSFNNEGKSTILIPKFYIDIN